MSKPRRRVPNRLALYPKVHEIELVVRNVNPETATADVGMAFNSSGGNGLIRHSFTDLDAKRVGDWFLHLAAHLKPRKAG